jgi:flavin reductase (DIM6/NTAB) family NADH-FMN oxidoreductase RutF
LTSKYGDFKTVEATRPVFDALAPFTTSQTPNPAWRYGSSNPNPSPAEHIEIDPYAKDRSMLSNYKLSISGIPRPISLISTVSQEGVQNMAPFSYFQVIDHDPPTFIVGFSARTQRPKDTLRNMRETGECVINIVSEPMIEAVNASSLDVPYGVSEWELSGLRPAKSTTVTPDRVEDAVFAIEGKVMEVKDLDYHGHVEMGKGHGTLSIIEATRFWVRKDALNEEQDRINLEILRPLTQLGGISYGRVRETFELPRPSLSSELLDKKNGLEKFLVSEELANQSD